MADNKIRMPQSSAGLTSFSDASTSIVLLSPQLVVVITLIIAIITIALNVL